MQANLDIQNRQGLSDLCNKYRCTPDQAASFALNVLIAAVAAGDTELATANRGIFGDQVRQAFPIAQGLGPKDDGSV